MSAADIDYPRRRFSAVKQIAKVVDFSSPYCRSYRHTIAALRG